MADFIEIVRGFPLFLKVPVFVVGVGAAGYLVFGPPKTPTAPKAAPPPERGLDAAPAGGGLQGEAVASPEGGRLKGFASEADANDGPSPYTGESFQSAPLRRGLTWGAGKTLTLFTVMGDPVARDYAALIERAFHDAGWTVAVQPQPPGTRWVANEGVSLHYLQDGGPIPDERALLTSLREARVAVVERSFPTGFKERAAEMKRLRLSVGLKPVR